MATIPAADRVGMGGGTVEDETRQWEVLFPFLSWHAPILASFVAVLSFYMA